MPSTHQSTRRWQALRLVILDRDGYVCQARKPGCLGTATDCGHVIAWVDGGTDDPANLRAECASCNRSAGATLGNRRRQLGPAQLTSW